MDLEKYKKVWSNQPKINKIISAEEIYKMARARSSSIVKWIFIIGILEFVVLNSLYFFMDTEKSIELYQRFGLENVVFYSQIIAYGILFYFLFQFYRNYKNISVVENTKSLLEKIVKTRKTVRNYVIFNLTYLLFIIVVVTFAVANFELQHFNTKQTLIFFGAMLVITIIVLGLFLLFYQLIYGILLRKLNKNFKEINKLDTLN